MEYRGSDERQGGVDHKTIHLRCLRVNYLFVEYAAEWVKLISAGLPNSILSAGSAAEEGQHKTCLRDFAAVHASCFNMRR
jgi:hypothetical protein